MGEHRRAGRKFAPLPPGIVRVRLEGGSAPGFASRLAALPGVKVITGPDEYPGGRIYLVVALGGEAASRGRP